MMLLSDIQINLMEKHNKSQLFSDIELIKNPQEINVAILYKNLNELVDKYECSEFPSVSCGIITYNEQENIKHVMDSLKGNFDQIILLDSESTDNTVKIVKDHFPEVNIHTKKWENDFSKQRNEVIKLCNTDWIYFIDADNTLASKKNEIKRIAKLINFFNIECVISPTIIEHNNHISENNKRMFPINKDIIFWGKVHEEPVYSKNLNAPLHVKSSIEVNHDGYNSEKVDMKSKTLRNYRLTKEMIKLDPNNHIWYFYLLREMDSLEESDEKIEKGLTEVFEKFNLKPFDSYYLDLKLLQCRYLLRNNKLSALNEVINEIKVDFPDCLDVDFYQSTLYIINNIVKTNKVINHLESMISLSEKGMKFSNISTNNDHIKANLSHLHLSIGNMDIAERYYKNIVDTEIKDSIKIFETTYKI